MPQAPSLACGWGHPPGKAWHEGPLLGVLPWETPSPCLAASCALTGGGGLDPFARGIAWHMGTGRLDGGHSLHCSALLGSLAVPSAASPSRSASPSASQSPTSMSASPSPASASGMAVGGVLPAIFCAAGADGFHSCQPISSRSPQPSSQQIMWACVDSLETLPDALYRDQEEPLCVEIVHFPFCNAGSCPPFKHRWIPLFRAHPTIDTAIPSQCQS